MKAQDLVKRMLGSRLLKWAVVVLAVGVGSYEISKEWHEVHHALGQIGLLASFEALLVLLVMQFANMKVWHVLLTGFGSPLRVTTAGRIVFIGQLGKYVPGSIWPILAQMELARADLDALLGVRSGRLRMASFPSAGATLMPDAIAVFRRRHPDIALSLATGNNLVRRCHTVFERKGAIRQKGRLFGGGATAVPAPRERGRNGDDRTNCKSPVQAHELQPRQHNVSGGDQTAREQQERHIVLRRLPLPAPHHGALKALKFSDRFVHSQFLTLCNRR